MRAPAPSDLDEAAWAPDIEAPAAPRGRRRYLLAGALLAALLYWLGAHRTSIPTLDPTGPGDSAAAAWMPRPSKQLELGMDPDQARRILGNPSVEHPARWQYGPSWVDFECGRVSGWYSAPARPLQVERDSAHQVAAGSHGAADCS